MRLQGSQAPVHREAEGLLLGWETGTAEKRTRQIEGVILPKAEQQAAAGCLAYTLLSRGWTALLLLGLLLSCCYLHHSVTGHIPHVSALKLSCATYKHQHTALSSCCKLTAVLLLQACPSAQLSLLTLTQRMPCLLYYKA